MTRESGLTETDNQIMAELSERMDLSYPCQYLSRLFVKTTVSELKKKAMHGLPNQSTEGILDAAASSGGTSSGANMEQAFTRRLFEEPEVVPYVPSFMKEEEKLSGADRGSAYHRVMELLDFERVRRAAQEGNREEEIDRQLESLVAEGRLSPSWRESIFLPRLTAFFGTSLARRMSLAGERGALYREQPFVLGLPASRLGEEFPEKEQVLIQGIIDVFFEEDEKIIVADYKTDVVKSEKELISRYQVQLDYYAEALERLTGKKVVEKIIYSFALGKEIMLY